VQDSKCIKPQQLSKQNKTVELVGMAAVNRHRF